MEVRLQPLEPSVLWAHHSATTGSASLPAHTRRPRRPPPICAAGAPLGHQALAVARPGAVPPPNVPWAHHSASGRAIGSVRSASRPANVAELCCWSTFGHQPTSNDPVELSSPSLTGGTSSCSTQTKSPRVTPRASALFVLNSPLRPTEHSCARSGDGGGAEEGRRGGIVERSTACRRPGTRLACVREDRPTRLRCHVPGAVRGPRGSGTL